MRQNKGNLKGMRREDGGVRVRVRAVSTVVKFLFVTEIRILFVFLFERLSILGCGGVHAATQHTLSFLHQLVLKQSNRMGDV